MTNATALTIFILTYTVIAIGKFPWLRLDRTGAAFVGAVAMVICGAVSENAARHAIDYQTLALLLGMMIVVANLRLSGAFTSFARILLLNARSGYGLLAMTVASAGILAAFFINDVVCLALTPLLIDTCEVLAIDALPFLIALATVYGRYHYLADATTGFLVAGLAAALTVKMMRQEAHGSDRRLDREGAVVNSWLPADAGRHQ